MAVVSAVLIWRFAQTMNVLDRFSQHLRSEVAAAAGEVAGSVGGALADLRLVVASLESSGDDLGVMLALFRERIDPQLMAQGVALV